MRLADRVAIVTGGSRGIGRAYTERFLHEGAAVVIADVDDANGEKTRSELRDLGTVEYVHCDVADAGSADSCVRETVERLGRVDILVNNAALYGDWEMGNQSFEYLKRVFDVNLHGVWLMTRAVAPHMVEQERGRIVNQASAAAYNYRVPVGTEEFGGLNAFNYQQTKWGVVGLTKFTAAQLGRWNITANCARRHRDRSHPEGGARARPRDPRRAASGARRAPRRRPDRCRRVLRHRRGALRDRPGARGRRRQVHAGVGRMKFRPAHPTVKSVLRRPARRDERTIRERARPGGPTLTPHAPRPVGPVP